MCGSGKDLSAPTEFSRRIGFVRLRTGSQYATEPSIRAVEQFRRTGPYLLESEHQSPTGFPGERCTSATWKEGSLIVQLSSHQATQTTDHPESQARVREGDRFYLIHCGRFARRLAYGAMLAGVNGMAHVIGTTAGKAIVGLAWEWINHR